MDGAGVWGGDLGVGGKGGNGGNAGQIYEMGAGVRLEDTGIYGKRGNEKGQNKNEGSKKSMEI